MDMFNEEGGGVRRLAGEIFAVCVVSLTGSDVAILTVTEFCSFSCSVTVKQPPRDGSREGTSARGRGELEDGWRDGKQLLTVSPSRFGAFL